jgi:hypothetical protein
MCCSQGRRNKLKCPKCGVELSEAIKDEVEYIKKAGLADITEDQRVEYVSQVIRALSIALEKVAAEPNLLNRAGKLKQLLNEWQAQGDQIIVPLLYSVKPEFRQEYVQLLAKLYAYASQV